jgi:hypothetical protein
MRNVFLRFIGVLLLMCTIGFVTVRGVFTPGVRFVAYDAPYGNSAPAVSR